MMPLESEENFYIQRSTRFQHLLSHSFPVYPHKFHTTHQIADARSDDLHVSCAGRIVSIRKIGKLCFWKVMGKDAHIQVVLHASNAKNAFEGDTGYDEQIMQKIKENGRESVFKINAQTTQTMNNEKSEMNHKSKNKQFNHNQEAELNFDAEFIHFETLNFTYAMDFFKRGDIVGFIGKTGKSKTGEQSVFASHVFLLSPCVRTLPVEHFKLKDSESIYRRRYLDLILNEESRNRFILRTKIINLIREYLVKKDFLEVETPMMNLFSGGAVAKPFITHHNELDLDLFMRISPELYLKMLVIGGMERVFEIGKQYRNEGIDLTHNPEFTTCEFYMAYADYNDLIEMTEEMLTNIVVTLHGKEEIEYWPAKREQRPDPVNLSFKRPYRRIDIVCELGKQMKMCMDKWSTEKQEGHTQKNTVDRHNITHELDALNITDYSSHEYIDAWNLTPDNLESQFDFMLYFMKRENIQMSAPFTFPRVLDKLIGEYIEPQCVSPTFLMNHPIIMSPLAKRHRKHSQLSERFELFVNKKEICNAYTELNDPFDQKSRFEKQAADAKQGDEEAMMTDHAFIKALEYGLPPTAGWGIGIDRLIMMLTNAANIKDVMLFPAMKPEPKIEKNN